MGVEISVDLDRFIGFDIQIPNSSIQLIASETFSSINARAESGFIQESGTEVQFDDVPTKSLRIEFDSTNGDPVGLAEVEVIGMVAGQ